MRAWALGTGSSGNALVLEAGDGRVLVDAGFPPRELVRRLRALDIAPESIEALIVTHEHHDHARGAVSCANKWHWQTYASGGTWRSLRRRVRAGTAFASGATLDLRTMCVRTVRVAHDAAEPVALVATARDTGERVGLVYDVGHATRSLVDALSGLDALVLESNHDEGWLRAGPYPPSVCERIAGPFGHLSNRAAGAVAAACAHRGLTSVVLAHLSQRCNSPELAHAAMRATLKRTAFRGQIRVSQQDHPIAIPLGDERARQMSFNW
ncbi:MAG TPA: MBL fold metallo-hydrolase [Gemmatimonadaceae bacterium]